MREHESRLATANIKRNIMLRVFVFASVLVMPLSAAAFTSNDLNMLCTKTDVASRSACAAYIEGAADATYNTIEAIGGTSGPQVGQYFCLPVDVKPVQLTDAVRKFIAENPDKANFNATTMVSLGLGKAFPCKAEN
jgi:Rap1a immunity proteins